MRKTAVVLGLLLCLVLCALPVFGASTTEADRHYNHFSVDVVATYGMLDTWKNAKAGRNVTYDRETNTINIHYTAEDVGSIITSNDVPIDDFMPFFLAGDKYVYYAGGGGTYEDGDGFSLVLYSAESQGYSYPPRAYELTYPDSAQTIGAIATASFTIKIPGDATGGVLSIPYIGIYRVNDTNRANFQFFDYPSPNFGTGSTSVAQGIFVPFNLNSLIDYERNQGYNLGYATGFQSGYRDGNADGLTEGRAEGYENGYSVGYEAGEDVGYANGYEAGTTEGGSAFYSLAGAVINVPIQGIRGLMNFEILGVNMLAFFGSILTLLALFWLIKLVV